MATSFYIRYPSSSASSNPANGTTGQTAPTTATEVGFVDGSGNLQPFSGSTAASGPNVTVSSSTLPVGGATSALQVTGNAALGSILLDLTNGTQITKSIATTPVPLTITQKAITVGTTAVRLTVSGSAPASSRVVLVATMDVSSSGKFYVGSSSVTSSGTNRGTQLVPGQAFVADNDAGDYYIISDTAAQTVEVMEQS